MTGDPFQRHRSLLFTVAYEMLGSAADAEDVVQEAWLRWNSIDQATVRDARSYLVRTVTRQALNRLRTLARRREEYVGSWLPEPVLTSPDVAEDVELAESVSMAMLTVLETLTPTERVVFVLREIFGEPFEDIARALDKTPAAVRQIAHRARSHVAARRPRHPVSRSEQQEVVARFRAAVETGDVRALLDVLAPDVVMLSDGGGVAKAFVRPILGSDAVARVLAAFPRKMPDGRIQELVLNGEPALRLFVGDQPDGTLSFRIENGRITHIYGVRNPHKLAKVDQPVPLSRDTAIQPR
ncbi:MULTISPECIES: RNA polymerase sigma-70 factor [Thermocrispum]|uniref:RNA polymerase sigma-70 factor n=1 Tax=Thermocrispum agreste TaxID=37925 RepID=A0A2W4JP90_9PSEU|nr:MULTISPECIES: RNA polymerase sigma-70 factor [Thermocrispum]PZN00781.1 MAG: RNA polymerase sigma-70 factor [Thermocrispum agreste]